MWSWFAPEPGHPADSCRAGRKRARDPDMLPGLAMDVAQVFRRAGGWKAQYQGLTDVHRVNPWQPWRGWVLWPGILLVALGLGRLGLQAETFGEVTVTVATMHSGTTWHGYWELRVWLENHGSRQPRQVRLVMPNWPWGIGPHMREVSRTVVIPPGGRMEVALWQPPLPMQGDDTLRVEIDGRRAGEVAVAAAGDHVQGWFFGARGGTGPATVFVSQGLDYGKARLLLEADRQAGSAQMATGPPDNTGRRTFFEFCWQPAPSGGVTNHWLELEYDPPLMAEKVILHEAVVPGPSRPPTVLTVIGVSGRELLSTNVVGLSAVAGGRGGPRPVREVGFDPTIEPVRIVRVEYPGTGAHEIAVDAVELVGPGQRGWASNARASSDMARMLPGAVLSSAARTCLRAELPASGWSRHWLGYTPYDVVLVTGTELRGMPPETQEALWRYTEAGGHLVVVGAVSVPEPWRSMGRALGSDPEEYMVGLGRCLVVSPGKFEAAGESLGKLLQERADRAARFWQTLPRGAAAHAAFRLVEQEGLPTRTFIGLAVGLVVLLGPLNLLLVSRLKRRIWLAWTVPSGSLLAAAGVAVYPLLREGVAVRVRVDSVTLLDQVNRRATTLATLGLYATLPPAVGLQFDETTEVTPLVPLERHGSGNSVPYQVDWSHGQRLRDNWVQARVPAMYLLRKSEARRERLLMEFDGEDPFVVNGLGAPIRRLWWLDSRGKWFTAADIGLGERAKLDRAGPPGEAQVRTVVPWDQIFRDARYGEWTSWATNRISRLLRPGTYLAELTENPFVETGLVAGTRCRPLPSRCVVLGITERVTGPGPTAEP